MRHQLWRYIMKISTMVCISGVITCIDVLLYYPVMCIPGWDIESLVFCLPTKSEVYLLVTVDFRWCCSLLGYYVV